MRRNVCARRLYGLPEASERSLLSWGNQAPLGIREVLERDQPGLQAIFRDNL